MTAALKLPDRKCVFCDRIKAGEFDYFDKWSVAFQPLNPVTPGHFLVVPRKHVSHALESPGSAGKALELAGYLANQMGLESANFITSAGEPASQSVMHLHVHIVPRTEGDRLVLPWTDQQEREWLRTEVARYLCSVTGGHSREAVTATARSLADALAPARADRERLASILVSGAEVK